MEQEQWGRLLESDLSPAELAKEITSDFLDYVKEETIASDASVQTKVLMSLTYLDEEQLRDCSASIESLCASCEGSTEDWVRVISGIVLRWLKKIPTQKEDTYETSVKKIASKIGEIEVPSKKYLLPMELIPSSWPFLDLSSLPETFDMVSSMKNPHFISRPRSEVKRIKVISPPSPGNTTSTTTTTTPPLTSTTPLPEKIPEKVQQLLQDAPLLTPENRDLIVRFFSAPQNSGIENETYIRISDIKSPAENKPGFIQVDEVSIKLDPKLRKWNITKKRKFVSGTL